MKELKGSSDRIYWHDTHHLCYPKHTGSCTDWRKILALLRACTTSSPESFHFYLTNP